jgi:16S rRNA (uracil1498-N3)-methyltransferase
MTDRYFIEQFDTGSVVELSTEEFRHAQVMRVKRGQQITLFDGRGGEATAEVIDVGKHSLTCRCGPRLAIDREAAVRVVIGVALPKGERQRILIEKAVELGASRLVPLRTQRGVAEPAAAMKRLPRIVIEASKQCGRNRLMEIADPVPVGEFLHAAPSAADRWFAHAGPDPAVADPFDATTSPTPPDSLQDMECGRYLAIGPEGGWESTEIELARSAGWQFVRWSRRTLRTETAALALLTLALGWKA